MEVSAVNFPFSVMPGYERMQIDQYSAKYNKYGENAERQIELTIELLNDLFLCKNNY